MHGWCAVSGPEQLPDEPVIVVERRGDLPFGKVYRHIIRDRSLPRNVRTIYTYLTTYAAGAREAYPSRDVMAEDVDLSVGAVAQAIRIGRECKLWHIVKVSTRGGYSYNKYVLHDLDGGYVPGSGPGRRAKGKPRGRTANRAPAAAESSREPQSDFDPGQGQNLENPRSKSDHKEDKQEGRQAGGKTTSTPPREAIADAHPQAAERSTQITLRFPKNFDSLDQGPAIRCIVRASTAAMKAAGRPLGRGVGDRIATQLSGVDRPQAVAEVMADSLARALAGEARFAWVFDDLGGRNRVQVSADPVFLHERYGAIPGAEACIDSMSEQGYSPHAIANTIAKTARDMGCEDEIPDGHYDGDDVEPDMYPDYGRPLRTSPGNPF